MDKTSESTISLWRKANERSKSQFLKMDRRIQSYFASCPTEMEAWAGRTKKLQFLCEVLQKSEMKAKTEERKPTKAEYIFFDDPLMKALAQPLLDDAKVEILADDSEWLPGQIREAKVVDDFFTILPFDPEIRLQLFQSTENHGALNSLIEFIEVYRECYQYSRPKPSPADESTDSSSHRSLSISWTTVVDENMEPELQALVDSLAPESRSLLPLLDPTLTPILDALYPGRTQSSLNPENQNARLQLQALDSEETSRLFKSRDELRCWMEAMEPMLSVHSGGTMDRTSKSEAPVVEEEELSIGPNPMAPLDQTQEHPNTRTETPASIGESERISIDTKTLLTSNIHRKILDVLNPDLVSELISLEPRVRGLLLQDPQAGPLIHALFPDAEPLEDTATQITAPIQDSRYLSILGKLRSVIVFNTLHLAPDFDSRTAERGKLIHKTVYCLYKWRHTVERWTEYETSQRSLAKLGLANPASESLRASVALVFDLCESKLGKVNADLEELHTFGLENYIDSELMATELDFKVRKLFEGLTFEIYGERWDLVFLLVLEAMHLMQQRDLVYAYWSQMDRYRLPIDDLNEKVFGTLISSGRDIEPQIRSLVILTSKHYTPRHVRYINDRVVCSPENRERVLESMFRVKLSMGLVVEDEDSETCHRLMGLENLPDTMDVFIDFHALSFYQSCLDRDKPELADAWMKLKHTQRGSGSRKFSEVVELVGKTWLLMICKKGRTGSKKVEFEVKIKELYKLPPQIRTPRPMDASYKCLSMNGYRKESLQVTSTCSISKDTFDSQACTVSPPPSSTRGKDSNRPDPEELKALGRRADLATNRQAAEIYKVQKRMSDLEMGSVPFCTVDIEVRDPIVLTWQNYQGEELSRKTNLEIGGQYHCLLFSYDAPKDEWLSARDFCVIDRPLSVELEGGSREPLLGRCGLTVAPDHDFVFKVNRHKSDHTIDKILAEVRCQSVAEYFVNRFQEITDDRFGRLRMLHVDFMFVFDDYERKTIIEFMTRERHFQQGGFQKFTSNWTWKTGSVTTKLLEAFSHFTYADSDGVLMITDLQGWTGGVTGADMNKLDYMLTDPVIHCQEQRTLLFGRTNQGVEGMDQFFKQVHKECNYICDEVGISLCRPCNVEEAHENIEEVAYEVKQVTAAHGNDGKDE